MPLSERGRVILARLEAKLPSRKALGALSFEEKLEVLDRLKQAADEYERTRSLDQTEPENT
jgi:hypothetical protein